MEHPTKLGNVRQSEFEGEEYLSSLEPVVRALEVAAPATRLDRKGLAALSAQLQQFQEDALGIKAFPPKPFPKLPATLFWDLRPRGALFHIAATCLRQQQAHQLKKLDFASPANRKLNLEILAIVRRELQGARLLPTFRIALDPVLGGTPAEQPAKAAVKALGAELASSPDAEGVTHVVHPFGPSGDPDDGKQYMRSLEARGAQVRVHWWYHPDSYDEFIPSATAPADIEPDQPHAGVWHVYVRWLTDSEKYNEWMNPIDYETEAGAAAREAAEAGGKRKADGSAAGDGVAKRVKTGSGEGAAKLKKAPEVSAWSEDLGGGVVRQTVMTPHTRAMDGSAPAVDLSHGQRPVETGGLPKGQPQQSQRTTEAVSDAPASERQVALHRVPGHAAWFRHDAVHDVEKRQLPEFFDDRAPSKSPQMYKQCRDAIIAKYREDVKRRLTYADARSAVEGDANAVQRVWTYLDAWGLINHEAPPAAEQPSQTPFEVVTTGPPEGVRVVTAAPASGAGGAASLYSFPRVEGSAALAAAARSQHASLLTRQDVLGGISIAPLTTAGGQRRFTCAATGADCTAVRYHCTKRADVDLCPAAFAEGRFPAGTCARDFVRIDAPAQPQVAGRQEWSDQETLLLLEAVEAHGEAWTAVAAHVATKSGLQCAMRFLQLPLEDPFFEAVTERAAQLPGAMLPPPDAPQGASAAADSALPFSDAGNPVMAQIAFLTAMVSPKIAAAAAQRALEVLSEEDPALAEEAARDGAVQHATAAAGGVAPAAALNGSIGAGHVRVAAAAALGAAAVRAKLMADEEEREMQHLVKQAVEAQMQKIEVKLRAVAELEKALESERASMEAARNALISERQVLATAPLPIIQPTAPPQPPPTAAPAAVPATATPGAAGAGSGQQQQQQQQQPGGSTVAMPVTPPVSAGIVLPTANGAMP